MTQLGDTLSDERRRQGKSLVDVEAATRIRGRLLEALEHGDYDQLPAPAYVKGYIQSYAKFLDIPSQPLLEMYKVDVRFTDEREDRDRPPLMPRGARYSKASRQNLDDLPAEPVVPKRDQQHAIPTRTWALAALAIVLVFGMIWTISKLASAPTTPPPVPQSPSVQETTTPAPSTGASVTAVAASSTPSQDTSAEAGSGDTSGTGSLDGGSAETTDGITPFTLSFRIHAGETSRLKITADGAVVFDETIRKTSDIPKFDVYREARIVIGNPRWVTTFKDGKRIPVPNQDAAYTLTVKNGSVAQ